MGLMQTSGSFTRFLVDGPLPEAFHDECRQRIPRFAFKGIDESSQDERADGWVNILDMLDYTFAGMEYLKEPYLAMAWRVDVRKVPSSALKHYCREAEEKIKEMESLEYLPKARRQEIRDMVHAKLLKRAIPRSQAYDMIWNLQTGIILFGGTAPKVCDEFAGFFNQCFELPLRTLFPYFMAEQIANAKAPGLLDDLDTALPE